VCQHVTHYFGRPSSVALHAQRRAPLHGSWGGASPGLISRPLAPVARAGPSKSTDRGPSPGLIPGHPALKARAGPGRPAGWGEIRLRRLGWLSDGTRLEGGSEPGWLFSGALRR
jgi:hypothetical protein